MTDPGGLQTFAGRLSTFDGPKQLAKRRASSTKKKTPTTASWPHERPAPDQLAKAGFYYNPSAASQDSVTCFLCQKALDGWDADDNPAFEHLSHVPDCGWAINTCIEQRIEDMNRAEEDPTSERMVEARRATFQDSWPHETKKGWKCKTAKMVAAGWYYSPLPGADDCVACAYCGISLDGWEPKDDPWQEHRKRAPDCHFFSLAEESANLQAKTKGKKGRNSRASRSSKASRLSTQSNVTLNDDMEFDNPANLDETMMEGDSVLTTTSTTSKAGRGRKKAVKPKPASARQRVTRGQEKAIEESIMEAEAKADELEEEQSVTEISKAPIQPPKRQRTKRTTNQKATVDDSSLGADAEADLLDPKQAVSKKRTTRQAQTQTQAEDASQLQAELDDEASIVAASQPNEKPKRGRKRMSNGQEKVDSSMMTTEDKPTRGRKKLSDGQSKLDSSVMVIEEPASQQEKAVKPKAKRGKAKVKEEAIPSDGAIPKGPPPVEQQQHETDPEPIAEDPAPKKTNAIPKKTKKASTQGLKKGRQPIVQEDDFDVDSAPEPPPEDFEQVPTTTEPDNIANPTTAPPSPTAPQPAPAANHSPSPSSHSQQSSDAENRPPSLRQSKTKNHSSILQPPASSNHAPSPTSPQPPQPQSPTIDRRPLQTLTPRASPSKRLIPGGLVSDAPWTAVDLEGAFLPWLHASDGDVTTDADAGGQGQSKLLRGLSSPEKNMSVEEWIAWNAAGAEERLRRRCEGMIGEFEGEGVRALRCLEGVVCLS